MATPIWFDSNAYMVNKAEQMGTDVLGAIAAFKNAGWPTDADSLFSHFEQFGNDEGVSPNGWFDVNQYLYDKAASFYDTNKVSTQQLQSMDAALKAAGFTAWDHYSAYWAEDFAKDASFHNPSTDFDANQYMADKLAAMQKSDSTYTMDKLVKAFQDNGFDPLSHYLAFGKGEGLVAKPVQDGTIGETFSLTNFDDTLIGTSGDDYFKAGTGTLGDNDYIDGGAGNDMLYANLKPADTNADVISPEIRNVETILFRAQTTAGDTGTNNTESYFDAENVTFDNKDAKLTIGSDNSRSDLEIEDVRWNSNQTTIRFSNTDPGDVDLSVYFDPQHLKGDGSTTTGILTAELIDYFGASNPAQGSLWNNPYSAFAFTLDGQKYTVDFGEYNNTTVADGEIPSYAGLIKQMQEAIAKDPVLSKLGLTVSLGDQFTHTAPTGPNEGQKVNGTQIVVRSDKGSLEKGNWDVSSGEKPSDNAFGAIVKTGTSLDCPLIKTDVELDNVGRVQWDDDSLCLPDDIINGSEAGDLVIGSMAARGGVERLDITVDRGSWLSSIASTNNTLRMITVNGEDIDGNGKIANGELYIGDWAGRGDQNGSYHATPDMWTWADSAQLLTAHNGHSDTQGGLFDVAVFDASTYKGDINIGAQITDKSYDKYLKDVDDSTLPNAPVDGYGGAFSYLTGSGEDVINMTVNGSIAADNDFKMNIDTGSGDDLVAFRYSDMTENQSDNQKNLKNVTINTGEGDDTVWFYAGDGKAAGAAPNFGGSVIINTGTGDDVIYANQQEFFADGKFAGGATAHKLYNAVFVFNTHDTRVNVENLEGATLANDTAIGASSFALGGTVTAGETLKVVVTFKGHVATATIKTVAANMTSVSAQEVNNAIISAIANDPLLSELLVAKDAAGHALIIESLINGEMSLADLGISFKSVAADGKTAGKTTINTSDGSATGTWYDTEFATNDQGSSTPKDPFKGNDSTTSQVIVDGGAGDDIIVLGPNMGKHDIVKATGGNDTLIGFESGEDQISLKGLLTDIVAGTDIVALGKNHAMVYTSMLGADKTTGIFSQAAITELVSKGNMKFATGLTAGDTAVVLLESKDINGNYVYTIVKMVYGTAGATGEVVGSYTLDAEDGIHNQIVTGDLTVNEVLRDSTTGITFDDYSVVIASEVTLTGTIFNDTFNNVNDDDLKNSASTALTGVSGGFGNDTFNVNGALAQTVTLNGDGGKDTFNIIATTAGIAMSAEVHGGLGNDIFNVTSTDTFLATIETKGLFGDGGNDVFNFKSVATATNGVIANSTAIFLINGGADYDTVNFTYENTHTTPGTTGKAQYTVATMTDVENIVVGKDVELTVSNALVYTDNVDTTVTISVDASSGSTSKLTMNATPNATHDKVVFNITGGLNADTITGGAGNDILAGGGGSGANSITGGKGNDTIVLSSSGVDTVVFSAAADNGTDIIKGFEVGTGKDVFDFKTNSYGLTTVTMNTAVSGGSAATFANETAYELDMGAAIAGKNYSTADFTTLFGATKAFASAAANAKGFIAVQGTDQTHIYFVDNDNNTTIDVGEVTFVGILTDVINTDAFHADNFDVA